MLNQNNGNSLEGNIKLPNVTLAPVLLNLDNKSVCLCNMLLKLGYGNLNCPKYS